MPVAHGFAIKDGSPQESGSPDGSEAVVTYVGPSENRYLFLQSVFGYVDTMARVWVPRIEYPNPLADGMMPVSYRMRPAFDGGSILTIDGNTIDSLSDTISNDCWTEIDITFSNKIETGGGGGDNPSRPDGTYLEISRSGGVEFVEVPGRDVYYDTGVLESVGGVEAGWEFNTPITADEDRVMGIPIVARKIVAKWKNVPYPDFNHIEAMCGVTNSEPWYGWPKYAVMLEDYSVDTSYDVMGTKLYALTYTFSINTYKIKDDSPFYTKFPQSVTRGMIGLQGRMYNPKESVFKLARNPVSTPELVLTTAPANDFDKLFAYQVP